MFPRTKWNGKYTYLQIVENHRVNGKTRQQVIASLGRLDKLTESGQLGNLTRLNGIKWGLNGGLNGLNGDSHHLTHLTSPHLTI